MITFILLYKFISLKGLGLHYCLNVLLTDQLMAAFLMDDIPQRQIDRFIRLNRQAIAAELCVVKAHTTELTECGPVKKERKVSQSHQQKSRLPKFNSFGLAHQIRLESVSRSMETYWLQFALPSHSCHSKFSLSSFSLLVFILFPPASSSFVVISFVQTAASETVQPGS